MGRRPPTWSNLVAPPLQCPLYRGCRQSVDCYFLPLNGSHLQPRPAFLSIFMGLALAPQIRESTAAPPNPMTSALRKPIGGGGTIIWWHRWPTPMEVEGEAAGGRAAANHVGCCVFLCVCFVLWCKRPFSYRSYLLGKKSKMARQAGACFFIINFMSCMTVAKYHNYSHYKLTTSYTIVHHVSSYIMVAMDTFPGRSISFSLAKNSNFQNV